MKQLVKETETKPLDEMLGKNITVFACRYFYHGKLVGYDADEIVLEKPSVIFETGKYDDATFKDIQSMGVDRWVIARSAIESYGEMK